MSEFPWAALGPLTVLPFEIWLAYKLWRLHESNRQGSRDSDSLTGADTRAPRETYDTNGNPISRPLSADPSAGTYRRTSEPLIGYKQLGFIDGVFVSQHGGAKWAGAPPQLVAECSVNPGMHPDGIPSWGCSCGIYSYNNDSLRQIEYTHASGNLWVRLRNFDKVIIAESGYKAERAVIEAVYQPACHKCWRKAQFAKRNYFFCAVHRLEHQANTPFEAVFAALGVEVIPYKEPLVVLCEHCREFYPINGAVCPCQEAEANNKRNVYAQLYGYIGTSGGAAMPQGWHDASPLTIDTSMLVPLELGTYYDPVSGQIVVDPNITGEVLLNG